MVESNEIAMHTAREQTAIYGVAAPAVAPVMSPQRSASAVSWSAIFAGAAAAAALSLILLILGTGLGLSSVSPWVSDGISAGTFGIGTILWITFTQLVAAGMGGYLAGRLRSQWLEVHTDEVYFRDTAHGFLAWAIASLATAALLTSVIGAIVHGGTQAAASVTGGVASGTLVASAGAAAASSNLASDKGDSSGMGYFLDTLFRRDTTAVAIPLVGDPGQSPAAQTTVPAMAEVTRIFSNALHNHALPEEDLNYLGQVVAQHTGLPQQDAEQRVSETFARIQAALKQAETAAREAADSARKASAYAAIWLFLSLLIGAFVASLAATYGGRQRDA